MGRGTRRTVLAIGVAILAVGTARAEPRSYALPESTAEFRPSGDPAHASGREAAEAHCKTCHSADYVEMQPPGKGQAFWQSEVTKMIKVYKAPIAEADAKTIADYLATAY